MGGQRQRGERGDSGSANTRHDTVHRYAARRTSPHGRDTAHRLSAQHQSHVDVRYSYNRDIVRNAGTGGFNLESRGYHNDALSQTYSSLRRLSSRAASSTKPDSSISGPTTVAQANLPGSAVQVLGAFNGGGNPIGHSTDAQDNYEFQNNTSVLRGRHTLRFGVRARAATQTNVSPQNYAGTFTFAGGIAPELDANDRPVLDATGQPVLVNISSIENYRRTLFYQSSGLPADQIRRLGGGASQFSINTGNPEVSGSQTDVGDFFGDDWRMRPNLTLNVGLRYETQTNIHDWTDLAPRVGVAWAPGGGRQCSLKDRSARRIRHVL